MRWVNLALIIDGSEMSAEIGPTVSSHEQQGQMRSQPVDEEVSVVEGYVERSRRRFSVSVRGGDVAEVFTHLFQDYLTLKLFFFYFQVNLHYQFC